MSIPVADLLAGIQAARTILDLVQQGVEGSISEQEYKEKMEAHAQGIQAVEDMWKKRHP